MKDYRLNFKITLWKRVSR